MGLKSKILVAVNVIIIFACLLMGIIGYSAAVNGFSKALEMKADSDASSLMEIMDYRYKGEWSIKNGLLYKGETKIDGANDIVDELSQISKGKVTFFNGDTRVATNVIDDKGGRLTGTKASENVINEVISGGKNFLGEADVGGVPHHAAYRPIKNSSGNTIGMLFVGVSVHEMDDVINNFLFCTIAAIAGIIIICALISNFVIGKGIGMLNEVADAMQKISSGNLKIEDLEIRTDDEIGTLANGINLMKKELKSLIGNVAKSAERVSASSQELTAVTQEGSALMERMAQNTAAMGEDAGVLSFMVNELQDIIKDMRQKMHILHASSNEMDEVAKGSAANAAIGKEICNRRYDKCYGTSQRVGKNCRRTGQTFG